MTLFVNLFGGPGIGKSTMAASLFAALKRNDISAEYVTEYAKELTWNGYVKALENQISVLGEQWRRMVQLNGKVDVVINDSPVLLCSVYAPADYPESFHALAAWCQESLPSLNLMLDRVRSDYEEQGRNQSFSEALRMDRVIRERCRERGIETVAIEASDAGFARALSLVRARLGHEERAL